MGILAKRTNYTLEGVSVLNLKGPVVSEGKKLWLLDVYFFPTMHLLA